MANPFYGQNKADDAVDWAKNACSGDAFGTVEAATRLWGGRVADPSHATMEITKLDEYWLYDHLLFL